MKKLLLLIALVTASGISMAALFSVAVDAFTFPEVLTSPQLPAESASSPSSFVFNRKLRQGDQGSDVKLLQKYLNLSPDTRVSLNGPGSLGNETEYFGPATHQAVIRFQEKYASEVLTPSGLTQGTGFVGEFTLKKLNAKTSPASPDTTPAPTTSTTTPNIPISAGPDQYKATGVDVIDIYVTDTKIKNVQDTLTERLNQSIRNRTAPVLEDILALSPNDISSVFVTNIAPAQVVSGGKITIAGNGFMPSNTIYFGKEYIVKGVFRQGNILTVTVPPIPVGKYDLVVKNSSGVSNSQYVVVSSSAASQVHLDVVQPDKVFYGDTLTLKGRGFTSNNDIVTTFGTFKGIASPDGTTLTVKVDFASFAVVSGMGTGQNEYPSTVQVVNENGFSEVLSFVIGS